MSSLTDPPSFPEDPLLEAALTGEIGADDPRLIERARTDAAFRAEWEGLKKLCERLEGKGATERAILQELRLEMLGERDELQSQFRDRVTSFVDDQIESLGTEPGPLERGEAVDEVRAEPKPARLHLLRAGGLIAAAAAALFFLRPQEEPIDPPATRAYDGIYLGEGRLEAALEIGAAGEAGELTWVRPPGTGSIEVRVDARDFAGQGLNLVILRPSGEQHRFEPLPWNEEHTDIRITVSWFEAGIEDPMLEDVVPVSRR